MKLSNYVWRSFSEDEMKKMMFLIAALFIACCTLTAQVSVKFVWFKSANATSYRLQASSDASFASTFYDNATIADSTITIPGFVFMTKYYWRVSASNSNGTSPWSEVWDFTTAPPIPAAVLLISPVKGQTGLK